MSNVIYYNKFRIEVRASPETNDHEVLFFGDDEDIIARFWDGSMGLDPSDILNDTCQLRVGSLPHEALIARCNCGCLGCGDVVVDAWRDAGRVQWAEVCGANNPPVRTFVAGTGPGSVATQVDDGGQRFRRILQFDASQYESEVERALQDTSWETPERTAARLVRTMLDHRLLAGNGFKFQWASGRARPGKFTVALGFETGPYQILVPLDWNCESPEEVAKRSVMLLSGSPANWTHAEWFPQRAGLGPPSIAGPTWRRGG